MMKNSEKDKLVKVKVVRESNEARVPRQLE